MDMIETIDAYILYFDLIGVTKQFLSNQTDTLGRLRAFQSKARAEFPVGGPHSTIKTLADNVWARVNANENIADMRTLELAGRCMAAAREFGFDEFFGVITRGDHVFDLADRTLVSGGDATDILVQHIDMTSEPHMRAAMAEKWSAHLAKAKKSPVPVSSFWVSEEVFDGPIEDNIFGLELPIVVRPEAFDLKAVDGPGGRRWPFDASHFRAVVLR